MEVETGRNQNRLKRGPHSVTKLYVYLHIRDHQFEAEHQWESCPDH